MTTRSLFRSTTLVSCMTFFSRILGFARDMLLASLFGATSGFDSFVIAFRIPNLFRRLFAEGAFTQAFVPVLSEYRVKMNEDEIRSFTSRMLGTLGLALLIITIVAQLLAPLVVMIFASGFIAHDPTRFELTAHMLRITFPYLLFISMTAFSAAVLNTYGRFGVPSFTPALLNIVMIASAIWLAPYFEEPIIAVAWGVFFAGIIQFLFQLPFLKRINLLVWPRINWRDPGVKRVLTLMVPAIFGVSVAQISILIDTTFASFLKTGSISWLYYSERLMDFPLGVFGVAIATVVLPHLSRHFSAKSAEKFSASLDWGLRLMLLVGIPAGVGLLTLAGPLMATLFQFKSGKFGAYDVIMAHKSLMAFALGIPAFMAVKVLAAGFYAQQNISTPVRIAVIAVGVNILFNFALIVPLAHAGLALATTISSIVNSGLLAYGLIKRKAYRPHPGWLKYALQLAFANTVMGLVLWFASGSINNWVIWSWQQKFIHLFVLIAIGIATYTVCLLATGVRFNQFKMRVAER